VTSASPTSAKSRVFASIKLGHIDVDEATSGFANAVFDAW